MVAFYLGGNMEKYIITFILSYILIYLIYFFYYILVCKRDKRCPAEATYMIRLYKLDINKFSYRKFIKIISLVTSFDIALAVTVVSYFDKIVWQILFGLVVIIPIIIISFMTVGKHYAKKQLKDNSKELKREEKYLNRLEKISSKFKKKGKKKNDKH